MRSALLLLALTTMSIAAAPLTTVRGHVESDGPLPGCTIRLDSSSLQRAAISDAKGDYVFEGVPEGGYEVKVELVGFETDRRLVSVLGADTRVESMTLRPGIVETITVNCSMRCSDDAPENRFSLPRCFEYDLHTALINAASSGDRSAVQLLQTRYATVDTLFEQHRIAGALLGRIPNDAGIWRDLVEAAEVAVGFPRKEEKATDDELQWAAQHQVDPDQYRWMAIDALSVAGQDSRSQALLLRALGTDDYVLVATAIAGLGKQHDFAALPLIASTIERFPEDVRVGLAFSLAAFADERADAVAVKYQKEEERETYQQVRSRPLD